MQSFLEAILKDFNVSFSRTQYLTVIENGISTIRDKCEQVNDNSLLIEGKILADYNFASKRKRNSQRYFPTPRVEIVSGIAFWNQGEHRIEERLEDFETSFGIHFSSFPILSDNFYNVLKQRVSVLRHGESRHAADYIINILRAEDLENLYEVIAFGDENMMDLPKLNNIRGMISELVLAYFLEEQTNKIQEGINLISNLNQEPTSISYSRKSVVFGNEYEIDVILHSNNKNSVKKLLNHINNYENVLVYKNPNLKPIIIESPTK